ncbi:MAG: hypothetical protein ACTIMZ_14595 [Pseudoalteromonas distincta]|uniref:hypothetical protein n=1 Tax=Pseudoalteromonas distincta TaxID=77608 RepID=UPI003F9D2A1E
MNQYARSGLFHEYMRKEQFNQSINDDIKQISMTGYRSKPTNGYMQFANTQYFKSLCYIPS